MTFFLETFAPSRRARRGGAAVVALVPRAPEEGAVGTEEAALVAVGEVEAIPFQLAARTLDHSSRVL